MTELRELTEPGRRKVKEVLEDGNRVMEIDERTLREYSSPIRDVTADLDGLGNELEAIIEDDRKDHEQYEHTIDVAAAEPVRVYLDIPRRVAAKDGLWHWLAVAKYPEFVYHRWRETGNIEEKFLAAGTDIYSNALHRLWWGAELTREGDDYTRTRAMFAQGELANDVLDRWFARYLPASHTIVDFLAGEDSDTVSDLTRDFRNELSSYTLELMHDDEIEALLTRLEDDL